jgi:hypothetical protein
MDLGGPVWHASLMARAPLGRKEMLRMANRVLDGVGDPRRGEWVEIGRALHLRRRLSAAEAAIVGPVVDVRGTPEAARRVAELGERLLAMIPPDVLADELAGPTR